MATIGTKLYTMLFGECVGEDEFGNRYFRSSKQEGRHIGLAKKERRWVMYKGRPEPSKIPPYWHGWIHYMTDDIPTEADQKPDYAWEKPHQQNFTGTSLAYRPPGHASQGATRDAALGDYEAWEPK